MSKIFGSGLSAAAALTLAACLAGQAFAEEEPGRYTMKPVDGGGFVRLDRQTGAMAICTGKDGNWSCKPMPDSEQSMKQRIEDLESENRALRTDKKVAEAAPQGPGTPGDTIPPDAKPGETVPSPPGDVKVPTEKDVDKLFDYVEGMVKKFKERIDRLEKEAKKEPATPL